jgi:hypothetical protein
MEMIRKVFLSLLLLITIFSIAYGGFHRKFLVYDNLEKFDRLKNVGIKIKIPGYEQQGAEFKAQSQWFTEPEMVNASTFEGVGKFKDGKLMSNYADLQMLRERRPCPT